MKINLLLLIFLLGSSAIVFADTNGIWHNSEDVKSGIFAANEGYGDFKFYSNLEIGNVAANKNLIVNGKIGIGTEDITPQAIVHIKSDYASLFVDSNLNSQSSWVSLLENGVKNGQ